MAYDGSIIIDTKIDQDGFKTGLNKLAAGAVVGVAAIGTAVATAFTAAAGIALSYNSTMETYTTSFKTMTGSADEAASIIARLTEMGAKTPFEMTDLADTTQLLMSFGFTADNAISSLSMLGDISQGNAEKLSSVSRAYGKMSSAGKVTLEDINMMIDAGFNPLQEMSVATGESMSAMYARISKGGVSVDEITASMQRSTSEGGLYFGAMEAQSKTFAGQMSTLKDTANNTLGKMFAPLSEAISTTVLPAIQGFLDRIGEGQSVLEAFSGMMGDNFGIDTFPITDAILFFIDGLKGVGDPEALSGFDAVAYKIGETITNIKNAAISMFTFISENKDWLLPIAGGIMAVIVAYSLWNGIMGAYATITGIVNAITAIHAGMMTLDEAATASAGAAQWLLNAAMSANPIGLIIALVAGLVVAFVLLWNNCENFRNFFINLWATISGAVSGAIDFMSEYLGYLGDKVGAIFSGIGKAFGDLVSWFTNLPQSISNAIGNIAYIGGNLIAGIWQGISDKATWLRDNIAGFFGNVVKNLLELLGIASPSKLMEKEVGLNMILGVGKGWEDNASGVISDMVSSVDAEMGRFTTLTAGTSLRAVSGAIQPYGGNPTTTNSTANNVYHITIAEGAISDMQSLLASVKQVSNLGTLAEGMY